MSNQKTFHLSAEEAEYLSRLMSEDSTFRNALPSRSEFRIDREALTLDHDEAELLRDYFTDRLARVGFDENYEPNEEGVMLERLTDMLFLPTEVWAAE
jgi:hypothetical protein